MRHGIAVTKGPLRPKYFPWPTASENYNHMNHFKSYRDSIFIKDHLTCKHIIAGDYSYYSGHHHGHSFEDCVMYLDALDNRFTPNETDQLIIGKFCAIANGDIGVRVAIISLPASLAIRIRPSWMKRRRNCGSSGRIYLSIRSTYEDFFLTRKNI
jgi:chloramphenicol O-acetyltransferase type B